MEITKSNNLPPQPPPTSHVANLTVDDFICTNDDTGNVTDLTNQQTNIENLLHATSGQLYQILGHAIDEAIFSNSTAYINEKPGNDLLWYK
jgi:hypothetical protein